MDKITTVAELKGIVQRFCEERGWDEVHRAKDLAIGIITEASELLEHFRFRTDDEARAFFRQADKRRAIVEELCDVLFPLLRFAQIYNIDLTTELLNKMKKSARKHPPRKKRRSRKLPR